MNPLLATGLPPVHVNPETLASHVDGRHVPGEASRHIVSCDLCRARAADARLLRALLGSAPDPDAARTTIPLDATTLAGYHDQSLPSDQMAAVDRRLLRDDAALLELIELRLGLNAALRAEEPDRQLLANTATAFATGQSEQSRRVASLGTLFIDRESQIPVFRYHAATPEDLASIDPVSRVIKEHPQANDSGSYPAPAARREVTLHAGRHTLRVRMSPGNRFELFAFDEQGFRPANGIGLRLEPEGGETQSRTTRQTGFAAFELGPGHARLFIDAGDHWLLELR